MNLHLIINYFVSPHLKRLSEYNNAVLTNINNKYISKLHIFTKDKKDIRFPSGKIKVIADNDRPTFKEMMNYANQLNGYVIIANLDIAFNDTLRFIPKFVNEETCIALTRYDNKAGKWKLFDRNDSQDAWIFMIPIKKVNADFCLGQRGCDNVLAGKLSKHYKVINPAGTINSMHMHKSGYRNYNLPMVPGGRHCVNIDKKRRYV